MRKRQRRFFVGFVFVRDMTEVVRIAPSCSRNQQHMNLLLLIDVCCWYGVVRQEVSE